MPKIRLPGVSAPIELPYLQIYDRRGKTYVYFRKEGHPRVRLDPESPGFMSQYERLCRGSPNILRSASSGSVAELVGDFLTSPEYRQLEPKTRQEYRRHLDYLRDPEIAGNRKATAMPRAFILDLRDAKAATPATANQFVRAVRRLFSWAIDHGRASENPAAKIPRLRTGQGHRPWEEYEIEAFRNVHALETLERAAFELTLGTAQRISDVVRMQRQHILDGWLSVAAQKKTGARVEIPLLNETRHALDVWLNTHNHMMILVSEHGRPLTVRRLSQILREAYNAAGLATVTTHGLRYTGARRHYEAGTDPEDIADITGHETVAMARKYAGKRRRTSIAKKRLDRALSVGNKNSPDNDT